MRLRLLPIIALLALATAAFAQGSPKITAKNWRQHPEIKKIRAIYSEVLGKVKRRKLKKAVREIHYCQPGAGGIKRTLYTQGGKLVRQYTTNGNFEGGVAEDVEYYYDAMGRLRFVFAIYTDNQAEAQVQYRLYYNARGKLIWENRRHVKGTKKIYAPAKWSKYYHLGDPRKDFNTRQSKCN